MRSSDKNNHEIQRTDSDLSLSTVLCELCLNSPSAASVALTGSGISESLRLLMTRTPSGLWVARLFLASGTHTFHIHRTLAGSTRSTGQERMVCWDTSIVVPDLSERAPTSPGLRIWLDDPACPVEGDQHRI